VEISVREGREGTVQGSKHFLIDVHTEEPRSPPEGKGRTFLEIKERY